jgi:parvulin-like peptidyl-prolyl isomerase
MRALRAVANLAAVLAALLVSIGARAQGIHPGDAVRINGVTISYQRFAGFYQEYRRTKGVSASTPGFRVPLLDQIRREAMDLMIEQELVRQAAEREGIAVSAGEEESHRKHIAGMLAAQRYLEGVRAAVPAVSDEELETYYRENEYRLTFPEQVRVRHILLTWKRLGTKDDRAAIREQMVPILERARRGEDFAALAQEYSDDRDTKRNGGDTGFFHRGQMVPAFEQVAFSLKPGEISDRVETPFGVHIIRLEERRPARLLPLDEIREQLRDHVHRERMDAAVEQEIARLRAAAEIAILVPH